MGQLYEGDNPTKAASQHPNEYSINHNPTINSLTLPPSFLLLPLRLGMPGNLSFLIGQILFTLGDFALRLTMCRSRLVLVCIVTLFVHFCGYVACRDCVCQFWLHEIRWRWIDVWLCSYDMNCFMSWMERARKLHGEKFEVFVCPIERRKIKAMESCQIKKQWKSKPSELIEGAGYSACVTWTITGIHQLLMQATTMKNLPSPLSLRSLSFRSLLSSSVSLALRELFFNFSFSLRRRRSSSVSFRSGFRSASSVTCLCSRSIEGGGCASSSSFFLPMDLIFLNMVSC